MSNVMDQGIFRVSLSEYRRTMIFDHRVGFQGKTCHLMLRRISAEIAIPMQLLNITEDRKPITFPP